MEFEKKRLAEKALQDFTDDTFSSFGEKDLESLFKDVDNKESKSLFHFNP